MVVIGLLVSFYTGMQRDRNIIANQAYDENNRFALSRLAIPKVDSSIQINSGVAIMHEIHKEMGSTSTEHEQSAPFSAEANFSSSAYSQSPSPSPSPTEQAHVAPASADGTRRRKSKANPFQSQRYL